MLIPAIVGSICTVSIVFYARFLVALSRQCSPRRIGYWIRLGSHFGENGVIELQESDEQAKRAA